MHATTDRTLLAETLRTALVLAIVLVALVPGVRDAYTAFGWLPLWLVGAPAAALWASHVMAKRADDNLRTNASHRSAMRRSIGLAQARRRVQRVYREGMKRAA